MTATRRRPVRVAAALAVPCLLVLPAFVLPRLRLGLAADLLAYAVAVLGVNVVVGYSAQVSLGHGAFVGIGAYATVILSADHHWPLLATIPVGAAVAFLLGVVVGLPAVRVRGLHLALVTYGVGVAFGPLVKRMEWLTGGAGGKGSAARLAAPTWAGDGSRLADARWQYLVTAAVAATVFALVRNVMRGPVGRRLGALRGHELAAQSFGVAVRREKVVAFGLGAAVAAVAGSLLMLRQPFAIDTSFAPQLSVRLYTAAFVGGTVSVWGPLAGGAVIVGVPLLFDALGLLLDPALVYGLALVLLTLFAPDGLAGAIPALRAAARRRRGRAPRRRAAARP